MKELKIYKSKIETELKTFFSDKKNKAKKIDPLSAQMVELLETYTLNGGKRVRSALMYYSYRCFSSKNINEIIKTSMALELLQSFFLIHDDIIDQDEKRRGMPSLHKTYRNIIKQKYNNPNFKHIGDSLAIVAGDVCISYANEVLTKTKFKNKNEAIKYMNNITHKVCYGQALDILSILRNDFTPQDAKKVNLLKTATYTVSGPLLLGAILANAKKTEITNLKNISLPLGEAFQIQDDIIGLFGDKKKIGKPIGSDIKEGKRTLLILKAIELTNNKDKKFLISKLGTKITKSELTKIKNIVKKSGSLDYCKNKIKIMIHSSKLKIAKSKFKPEGKQFLLKLCDFLINREY